MKRLALSTLLASSLIMPAVFAADEEDHSAHQPGADAGQPAAAQTDNGSRTKKDPMQDAFRNLQDLMSRIQATSNPQERERLLKEHTLAMHDAIRSMRAGMDKGGMMGGKKKKGEAESAQEAHQHGDEASSGKPSDGGDGGEMMKGGMMKMHKKMEARMDAMQKMLEQLVEHEAAEDNSR